MKITSVNEPTTLSWNDNWDHTSYNYVVCVSDVIKPPQVTLRSLILSVAQAKAMQLRGNKMYFQEFSETFQNDCGKKVSASVAP